MYKVFIGTEEAQWLPTEVLKHSILRRSSSSYEFVELKNIPISLNIKMYTGFSFYRFSIPETCQFQGRALYLDADIVVLCDLKELFEIEIDGYGVLSRPYPKINGYFTSVMIMDCAKLTNWKIHQWVTLINAKIAGYRDTMAANPLGLCHKEFGPLDTIWNDFDQCSEKTKILHYTYVPTQPWKKAGHPYAYIFLKEMKSALDASVFSADEVKKEIDEGHIYPEILADAMNS